GVKLFVKGPVVAWNCDIPAPGEDCASMDRRTTEQTILRRVPADTSAALGHTSRMNCDASSSSTSACSSAPAGMSGQRAFSSSTVANGRRMSSIMTPPLLAYAAEPTPTLQPCVDCNPRMTGKDLPRCAY